MTYQEKFVADNLKFAKSAAAKKGFSYLIPLTMAAQEGGWGQKVVGNNFFGIKDTDGVNGNEVLITTTEYGKNNRLKFPVILRIIWTGKLFKYTVKDYFRKYDTAEIAFNDLLAFFEKNSRYATALKFRSDPGRFFEEIQKAGYATDPNYSKNLKLVMQGVIKRLPR